MADIAETSLTVYESVSILLSMYSTSYQKYAGYNFLGFPDFLLYSSPE